MDEKINKKCHNLYMSVHPDGLYFESCSSPARLTSPITFSEDDPVLNFIAKAALHVSVKDILNKVREKVENNCHEDLKGVFVVFPELKNKHSS